MNRPEARQALEQKVRDGIPHPVERPTRLHLEAIRTAPELYQFRRAPEYASKAHIHEMARKAKDGVPLGNVVVWWGGDGWYCIDGHHRLEAYRIGRWPCQKTVPVIVFVGTVVQAMLKALHCNAPAKLQMTKRERTQAAWELVVTTTKEEASAAAIAKASTVSERQVFSMRAVKTTLLQQSPGRDLTATSWAQARSEAKGEALEEAVDWDARLQEEAQRVADVLARHLGSRYQQQPEIWALALEMFDRSLPGCLAEHWRGLRDVSEFDLEEEEAEF